MDQYAAGEEVVGDGLPQLGRHAEQHGVDALVTVREG